MLFKRFILIPKDGNRVYLAFIILIGLGLRLFQLGHDSLWNDEAGVVLAALSPTIQGTIDTVRTHVMAMPLDYLVIRGVARISLHEFVLRLPSAIFGSLALIVCYRLFRRLVKERTAILATLFLALSTLHIMYSQEVRFYSSLVLFYYLSTNLLLDAIERNTPSKWGLFTLVFMIGGYFHIFALLSVLNGIMWIILRYSKGERNHSTVVHFLASLAIASTIIIPGYLYFGSHQQFDYPLLPWNHSLLQEVAFGLGWCELPFTLTTGPGQVWYIISFGLFLIGVIVCLRNREKVMIAFLLSSVMQICIIVLADILKGYWFAYRQILHLLPWTLLVSAMGASAFVKALRDVGKVNEKHKPWLTHVLMGALLLTNIPALIDYYQWTKSDARQISEYLSTNWSPGTIILVAPGYQEKVYRYYLQYVFKKPDMVALIHPSELSYIIDARAGVNDTFLIVIENLSDVELTQLSQIGFDPIKTSHRNTWLGQSVFIQKVGEENRNDIPTQESSP